MNIEAGNGRTGQATGSVLNSAPSVTTGHTSRPLNTLESLKSRLLDELLGAETNAELIRRLRRAADESASLAWASPFPLLTLPELLTEKIREAQRQFERQRAIQSRGRNVLQIAA
jgi:hypothetical protein